MIKSTMAQRKNEVAREIAYMFLFGDVQDTTQELDSAIIRLYIANRVLFAWRSHAVEKERLFLYVASKYAYGIDLSRFNSFQTISKEDHLYKEIRETGEVDGTKLKGLGMPRVSVALSEMMLANLNYLDLDLVSENDSVKFYFTLHRGFPRLSYILVDLMKGYIGNKILEGILDKKITNRRGKEGLKKRLCETYFIEAPSDQEIVERHVTNNRHIDFERFNLNEIFNLGVCPEKIKKQQGGRGSKREH